MWPLYQIILFPLLHGLFGSYCLSLLWLARCPTLTIPCGTRVYCTPSFWQWVLLAVGVGFCSHWFADYVIKLF